MHTHWSWDTADSSTMRKAAEKAVQLGLPTIAFTEHLDFTVWDPDDRATDEGLVERHASRHAEIDVQGYFAELTEVRERFPELRILSGVETGEPHLFGSSVAAYLRNGSQVVFTHTEVEIEGSGLGSALVRAALDDVRAAGGTVVPQCSFVRGWIDRHPEYRDLVAQEA